MLEIRVRGVNERETTVEGNLLIVTTIGGAYV